MPLKATTAASLGFHKGLVKRDLWYGYNTLSSCAEIFSDS